MFKRRRIFGFVLIVLSLQLLAPASEASESAEEGGEAKAKPAQKDELQETRIEVDKRQNKVRALREEIKKMIEEKNHLPKSAAKDHSDLMKLIETKYKEYRTEYEDLQKARTRLRFRFPEKGEKKEGEGGSSAEAKAEHPASGGEHGAPLPTLDELEVESGLDAELSKSLDLMRSQYQIAAPKKPKVKKKRRLRGQEDEDDSSDIIMIQK